MRLTLRTMLAYLDDVLDPADAQELGARISESEFASELVHRVRSSARKMRLSAPELEEQGVGAELNSVADYLDNVLPEEQLSEFEQVCLESDVHLAEVTCCHQILTLVLGEPAVIPDGLRERIYRVDSQHREWRQPVHQQSAAESSSAAVQAPPVSGKSTGQGDVPDFMKPVKSIRSWHFGVAAVLLVMIVLAFPAVRSQLGWFGQGEQELTQQDQQATANENSDISDNTPAADLSAANRLTTSSADETDTDPVTPSPEELKAETVAAAPVTVEPVTEPAGVQPIGKLVSENQLLLRWQPEEQAFEPVPVDTALKVGERFLVPPGFRAQIALASGLEMTVAGHAFWQWVETPGAQPQLELLQGRFVFSCAEESVESLTINCAGRRGWLVLPEQESQVAVELWRYLPPGKDPREAGGERALQVYQLAGGSWSEAQNDVTKEQSSGIICSRALSQQALEQIEVEKAPGWISPRKQAGSFDEIAMVALAKVITNAEPLVLQLQTLHASHRLHEVRALAARSLATLGEYDALLESFHDKTYRASWEKHFDLLRNLVALDPDTATAVQMAFDRQRADDGKHLFRLTWGYNSDQLETAGARQLVQWLSDEAIDTRVLAFLNLKRITGKTQLFFPEKPIGQQTTAIRGWGRLLQEGSIVRVQDPTPWNSR